MRRSAALVALLWLSGCTWTYTETGIPLPQREMLAIGRTTKPEALAVLGPPHLVRRQFDGDLYTWRRTTGRERSLTLLPVYVKLFHYSNGESRRDDLSLLFDREGILRGAGRRLETEEDGS
jgi:hypothetical protein